MHFMGFNFLVISGKGNEANLTFKKTFFWKYLVGSSIFPGLFGVSCSRKAFYFFFWRRLAHTMCNDKRRGFSFFLLCKSASLLGFGVVGNGRSRGGIFWCVRKWVFLRRSRGLVVILCERRSTWERIRKQNSDSCPYSRERVAASWIWHILSKIQ